MDDEEDARSLDSESARPSLVFRALVPRGTSAERFLFQE
jgi:hypothetical protein